jgi:hypothetical protein
MIASSCAQAVGEHGQCPACPALLGLTAILPGSGSPRRVLPPVRPGLGADDAATREHRARAERGHRDVVRPGGGPGTFDGVPDGVDSGRTLLGSWGYGSSGAADPTAPPERGILAGHLCPRRVILGARGRTLGDLPVL